MFSQECQKCPEGTYIFRSDNPSFECQPCPASITCLNGRLLEENTKQVDVGLAVSGLTDIDMKSPEQSEAMVGIMATLAETLGVVGSSVLFDGVAAQGRRQAGAAMNIKLKIYAPGDRAAKLGDLMRSSNFTEALKSSLAAMNVTATVASVSEAVGVSTGGKQGWVYTLDTDTGVSHLIDCPKGYLVKNDTVESQTCVECGPTTYSVNPMDNCRPGMLPNTWECANRECHVSFPLHSAVT
jgi:hypothetical protein